ncbi:hypothetical protein BE08_14780 [Sorangium cellulosum]|uniref:Secreted protein n=1 Tax=Sorangium cellulosum TaxID=56 RepID=A0A150PRB0_SORCE|nr:hypothetical protein BE08_14780 [Sorangium cellulosum]
MRFPLKLAFLVGALAGALPPLPAKAADGAGLFALPPSRLDGADRAALRAHQQTGTSGKTVMALIQRAVMATMAPPPAELHLAPLVSRGGGGGLRLVLPVCEDGCSRYASRGVLLVTQQTPDSPMAWLAAVSNRGARAAEGPPGLAPVREEARNARAKVPQEEESALPE